jgi:hypothetical protein
MNELENNIKIILDVKKKTKEYLKNKASNNSKEIGNKKSKSIEK